MIRNRSVRRSFALLLAGLAVAAAARADIVVGQTAGFTGPVAAGVKETTDGAKLYIDAVNTRGGVNGQRIALVSLDDRFDPKLTAENARKLIVENKAIVLFLTRGTPHAQALLPLLAEYQVPLVAPSTGAMVLHQPVNPWVFNVRATYQREAEQAVRHLDVMGLTRIAVLHTDDSFGSDSMAGVSRGFAADGRNPLWVEKFPRDKPDFTALAKKVAQTDAQAVVFIGSGSTVADGARAIRAAGSRAQIVTLSNNAAGGFVKSMGEHAAGTIVSQVFPSERSLSTPLVKEAADLAKARSLQPSPAMLEGFAAAKVLVEGLRRAGPNPTGASLTQALNGLKNFDLGGMQLSYSPTDHTGLDFVDLSIVAADGRFTR